MPKHPKAVSYPHFLLMTSATAAQSMLQKITAASSRTLSRSHHCNFCALKKLHQHHHTHCCKKEDGLIALTLSTSQTGVGKMSNTNPSSAEVVPLRHYEGEPGEPLIQQWTIKTAQSEPMERICSTQQSPKLSLCFQQFIKSLCILKTRSLCQDSPSYPFTSKLLIQDPELH